MSALAAKDFETAMIVKQGDQMPISYRRRNPGTTKRLTVDALAQQAMLAMIPLNEDPRTLVEKPEWIARRAYEYAIALDEHKKARKAAQATANPEVIQ